MSTFNKHISGLKVRYFEMPNATYTTLPLILKMTPILIIFAIIADIENIKIYICDRFKLKQYGFR